MAAQMNLKKVTVVTADMVNSCPYKFPYGSEHKMVTKNWIRRIKDVEIKPFKKDELLKIFEVHVTTLRLRNAILSDKNGWCYPLTFEQQGVLGNVTKGTAQIRIHDKGVGIVYFFENDWKGLLIVKSRLVDTIGPSITVNMTAFKSPNAKNAVNMEEVRPTKTGLVFFRTVNHEFIVVQTDEYRLLVPKEDVGIPEGASNQTLKDIFDGNKALRIMAMNTAASLKKMVADRVH